METHGGISASPQYTPRAFVVYTLTRNYSSIVPCEMEIDPRELYNLDAASAYVYYCDLAEALFDNIPSEMKLGLSADQFTLRLNDKAGFRKDYDLPFWGQSKAAKIKSRVLNHLGNGFTSLIDVFLKSISYARRYEGQSALFSEVKAQLLHRCIKWEDIGQFDKVPECECGGSRCMVRIKNELEKLANAPPEHKSLVEPVVSKDGKMWGWPEEQKWYDLELTYAGKGNVIMSSSIGIYTDCVYQFKMRGRRSLTSTSMNYRSLALRSLHSSTALPKFPWSFYFLGNFG